MTEVKNAPTMSEEEAKNRVLGILASQACLDLQTKIIDAVRESNTGLGILSMAMVSGAMLQMVPGDETLAKRVDDFATFVHMAAFSKQKLAEADKAAAAKDQASADVAETVGG